MQYNKVTWYSKLAAMILFIALPFMGFYLGMKYQEGLNPGKSDQTVSTPSKKDATGSALPDDKTDSRTVVKKINNEELYINVVVVDEGLSYDGAVMVPTPCHTVKDEVIVAESFPEQVRIDLKVVNPDPSKVCTQVVTNKEFSGMAKVSSEAQVSVYLDGEKID